MHIFYNGNDDREIFFTLKKEFYNYKKISFFENEYSVEDAINIFKKSEVVIGMRFHSVVFGTVLGAKTIAIDYDTSYGKVTGFCEMINNREFCINIKDVNEDKLIHMFNKYNTIDYNSKYQEIYNYLHENINKNREEVYFFMDNLIGNYHK